MEATLPHRRCLCNHHYTNSEVPTIICFMYGEYVRELIINKSQPNGANILFTNCQHESNDTDNVEESSHDVETGVSDLNEPQQEVIQHKILSISSHYTYVTSLPCDLSCAIVQSCLTSQSFFTALTHYIENYSKRMKHRLSCRPSPDAFVIPCRTLICINMTLPSRINIDYIFCHIVLQHMARRLTQDHAMACLSTLGGGYSALGDHFKHHSLTAGRISSRQLLVAQNMDDPAMIMRCRLFFALSLMQRGYLRHAKYIIRHQYSSARLLTIQDDRLLAMCQGIWAKLKYLYSVRKSTAKSSADQMNNLL